MLRFCTEIRRGGKIFRGIRAAAGKDRGEKNRKGQDAQGHLIQHETAVVADARRECRLRRFVRYAVGSAGLVALLLQGKLVTPHPLRTEERRVGKGWVRTWRFWGAPDH